jgi:hypothetical protein
MAEFTIRVKLESVQPTLMHSNQTCNPLNKFAKAMKAITGKRKKTDEDFEQLAKIEWEAGLYYSPELGPYIPSINIEGMLRDAAKKQKLGTAVKQSVRVFPLEIPLGYNGPRDLEGLKKIAFSGEKVNGEDFFDSRAAKNPGTGSTIMRTRPRFNKWWLEFDIIADDTVFNEDDIVQILATAGTKIGLSDYRPRYGTFEFKIIR